MTQEMEKIRFSNVGGGEDVILLQGRYSFDPRQIR